MKITPLEIRQKTFEKVFRGYDKDEVSAYLQSLSQEWERLVEENKEMSIRIESLEKEVSKLREVESSLFKTLKTAEDTGATLIEQAKKETEIQIKQSNIRSDEIISEARSKAKQIISQTETKTKQILDEMLDRVKSIEADYNKVSDLREKLIEQVRGFSTELDERIKKFEKKSEEHSVKDLVREAKETYHSAIVDLDMILHKQDEKKPDEKEKPVDHKQEKIPDVKKREEDRLEKEDKKSLPPDEVNVDEESETSKSTRSFFDEIE